MRNDDDWKVMAVFVFMAMVLAALLVNWSRGWAAAMQDPYPAPTLGADEGIVIIPHHVAEGTMVSVQIGENYIICDTTPGGLQCQSANISAIYIEEGEIHILTYGQSGYVCTVAGCREFVY